MSAHIIIPRRALFAVIIIVFFAMGSGLAYIYLPSAKIVVSPHTLDRQIQQNITLSSSLKEPDFAHFGLPANALDKSAEVTRDIKRNASSVTEDFAKGTVTLHNDQNDEQPLLPKTHLRHEASGTQFLTDNAVRIPVHGTVDVGVTAENKGASGNVPAGKFIVDKLPTDLQNSIFGQSQTDFTGGESSDTPLTADELASAKKAAEDQAKTEAKDQLTTLAKGAALRDDLTTFSIDEEKTSADVGSKATSYQIYVRVRARAFVVNDNDLLSLTLLALRALPASDEDFLSYKPDSFKIQLKRADFDRGEAQISCSLTGTFTKKIDPSALKTQELAGRTDKEVKEYFKQFDSIGNVSVNFWPFWVHNVPSRPGSVTTTIKST